MKIERVLLGPALGDREYGLLATSPNLDLEARRMATLGAFILGARSTTTKKAGRFSAFFPLDGRNDAQWALAIAEVTPFEQKFVVHADALIFSRDWLEGIKWAVHRIALAASLQARPEAGASRVAQFDMAEGAFEADIYRAAPSPGPSPEYFTDVLEQHNRGVHVEVGGDLNPFLVQASLWETLPVDLRRGRTFCTEAGLSWRPADQETAEFDVTFARPGSAPPSARKTISFVRDGLVAPPSYSLPWRNQVHEFSRVLRSDARIRHKRLARGEFTDPTEAYRHELRAAQTTQGDNRLEVLAIAAEIAGAVRRKLDADHAAALGRAILREFEDVIASARGDTRAVARALDTYCARIGPRVPEASEALATRLALDSKALLLLSPSTISAIAPGLFSSNNFPARAANVVEESSQIDPAALAVLASQTGAALRQQRTEERVDLACEIVKAVGRTPQTDLAIASDLMELLYNQGRIGELAEAVRSWTRQNNRGGVSADWLRQLVRRFVSSVRQQGGLRYPGRDGEVLRLGVALQNTLDWTRQAAQGR